MGIGIIAFFYSLTAWQSGAVSNDTARIVFGTAVIPSFVFFAAMSGYCLITGFKNKEVITKGLYSAGLLSRAAHPTRYWIAIGYHLLICAFSAWAAKTVITEITK
jgi:hypothetical protein